MIAPRTGGQILVANLIVQGVDLAFCVPGESYLAVLDALHDARDRHPRAGPQAEAADRLLGIVRAARQMPAARPD